MRHMNRGTCSRAVEFEVEGNVVKSCQFIGGCHGNTQGIAKLVVGRPVDEIIECLQGIDCNGRGTSCPAQLAEALKEYKAANQ